MYCRCTVCVIGFIEWVSGWVGEWMGELVSEWVSECEWVIRSLLLLLLYHYSMRKWILQTQLWGRIEPTTWSLAAQRFNVNIKTFYNIYNYIICILMHEGVKHVHRQIIYSMFVQNTNIHNYGTRHIELYCTPIDKTNLIRDSLKFYK